MNHIRSGVLTAAVALVLAALGSDARNVESTDVYHYVALGDSFAEWSDFTCINYPCALCPVAMGDPCPGYVEDYRAALEPALGVDIEVRNFACSGDASAELLNVLQHESYNGLNAAACSARTPDIGDVREAIEAADLVSLNIGFNDWAFKGRYACGLDAECWAHDDVIANFRANWDAILEEIDGINPGVPVVTMDVYNPWVDEDGANFAFYNAMLDEINNHISTTAVRAPVARVHESFNGLDGLDDPETDRGYVYAADHVHPNAAGAAAMALALCTFGSDNDDRNFIDNSPYINDDYTRAHSDAAGAVCDLDDDDDDDDDNDGLSDAVESGGAPCGSASAATDPSRNDTDGDAVLDGAECALVTDPANAASKPAFPPMVQDPDTDRLTTAFETLIGTDPAVKDTDGDGLQDGWEFKGYNTDPLVMDTDGDGVKDGCEVASINSDSVVNPGDQALLTAEILRVPPPAKLANFDLNKDGVINPGDQSFQASMTLPGKCPLVTPWP